MRFSRLIPADTHELRMTPTKPRHVVLNVGMVATLIQDQFPSYVKDRRIIGAQEAKSLLETRMPGGGHREEADDFQRFGRAFLSLPALVITPNPAGAEFLETPKPFLLDGASRLKARLRLGEQQFSIVEVPEELAMQLGLDLEAGDLCGDIIIDPRPIGRPGREEPALAPIWRHIIGGGKSKDRHLDKVIERLRSQYWLCFLRHFSIAKSIIARDASHPAVAAYVKKKELRR